jgi:hypothetical protein
MCRRPELHAFPGRVRGDGHVPDHRVEPAHKRLRFVPCYLIVKGKEDALRWIFKRRKRFVQVLYFKKGPVLFAARYEMELAGHMFGVGQG